MGGENTLDLIFTNEVSLIKDTEVNKSNKSDHSRVEISTNFIIKEENMQKPHNNKITEIKDVNFHEPNIDWNKVEDITKVKIKETSRDENDTIMETEELVKLIQEISLEYLPKKKRKRKGQPMVNQNNHKQNKNAQNSEEKSKEQNEEKDN